jgi:hypothetical protein
MLLNWQYRLRENSHWFWVIVVSTVLLLGAILIMQTRESLINKPVMTVGIARIPTEPNKGINLGDGRELIQEFFATENEATGLEIGIYNLRGADPAASVMISVNDTDGKRLARSSLLVGKLRNDDYTKIEFPIRLFKGNKYNVSLSTLGVAYGKELTVFHEPEINSLPGVELFGIFGNDSARHKLVGHLGFKIIREPSLAVLYSVMAHSIKTYLFIGCVFAVLIFMTIKPLRNWIKRELQRTILFDGRSVVWREKIIALILGLILALICTFPFYLNINKMDTMGDVQRNLLFRALGRESLLKEGMIAQWDPYTCGGVPLLANIESAHTDPYFFLSFVFGENLGLRLSVTLTLAIGFIGTYLLARRFFGVNIGSAILAGAIYSFSGFQMLAFSTGVFAWIPVGLIPFFIYFYLRSLERNIYIIPTAGMLMWIFFGGGPHMPVFTAILVTLLAIGYSVVFRSLRPLLLLFAVFCAASLLSTMKLLPTTELVVIFDAFNRVPSFIAPLGWIPKMFLDRHQDASFAWNFALTGENYRWSEFGSYVGLVPALLLICSLPFIWRKKIAIIWLLVGIIILAMMFGFFPWTLIQQIPVLREIVRNPQRLRSILFLPLGLLAAYGLSVISEKFIKNNILRNIAVGLVVLFVVVDLLSVGAPNFNNLFNLDWPKLERSEKFVRLNAGYADEDAGYYKAGYLSYLANQGTMDLCVPNMAVNRPMMASGNGTTSAEKPYWGEAYILGTDKKAEITYLSPTKIIVKIENLQQDGWLVLNQNFYPGWSTVPAREVAQKKGLVATRVKAGDTMITFKYLPLSFIVGFWVSLTSIIVCCFVVARSWVLRKRKPGK